MTGLPGLLTTVDTVKLRSSPGQMRAVLTAVVAAGEAVWTGPLDGLFAALRDVARVDLCLARLVEGHADAMRIIDQAGARPGEGIYGVWASRSAGTGLSASAAPGGWMLDGVLRFASGIGLVDRALVSSTLDDDHHLLLDIGSDQVDPDLTSWSTAAMDAARSFTVRVDGAVSGSAQVGHVDFYLSRPGFAVGGLGVAAVWAGGARHVVDAVVAGLRDFTPTAHQSLRLGLMEQAVWTADLAVSSTAAKLGGLNLDDAAAEIGLARTAVVLSCDIVSEQAPVVVGPAGLSTNARLARVLGDLGIYVRQHHLDTEAARLGTAALATHRLLGT